ncbi:GntR family transcriptional regulator [Maritalea mediterranea]|uniref:GntR family transcriptional regulator n=1 Tax=Maritalea mediterranea TaxID=2909667 RepID=A0ABS9E8Z7_9HYPH|nr:GntR family transcriptional regulator [Maritalea mediterranea]
MNNKAPGNLREQAYGSFTEHLLARSLRPGQFVSQRELVELTGLGLGAIRELIPRLEAEGLIKTVPKRGMQIAHVDLNLIRDAFEFRIFIETEATALFTQRASDADIERHDQEHRAIIAECENAAAHEGIQPELVARAQAIDWGFHHAIVDALGNRIIGDAYRVNMIKIRLIKQEQTQLNNAVIIPTMKEHLDIIDAIKSRDPAAADAAMRQHITGALHRAIEQR